MGKINGLEQRLGKVAACKAIQNNTVYAFSSVTSFFYRYETGNIL